jgi:hypothetical protein
MPSNCMRQPSGKMHPRPWRLSRPAGRDRLLFVEVEDIGGGRLVGQKSGVEAVRYGAGTEPVRRARLYGHEFRDLPEQHEEASEAPLPGVSPVSRVVAGADRR